jgi:hypothetical protein
MILSLPLDLELDCCDSGKTWTQAHEIGEGLPPRHLNKLTFLIAFCRCLTSALDRLYNSAVNSKQQSVQIYQALQIGEARFRPFHHGHCLCNEQYYQILSIWVGSTQQLQKMKSKLFLCHPTPICCRHLLRKTGTHQSQKSLFTDNEELFKRINHRSQPPRFSFYVGVASYHELGHEMSPARRVLLMTSDWTLHTRRNPWKQTLSLTVGCYTCLVFVSVHYGSINGEAIGGCGQWSREQSGEHTDVLTFLGCQILSYRGTSVETGRSGTMCTKFYGCSPVAKDPFAWSQDRFPH